MLRVLVAVVEGRDDRLLRVDGVVICSGVADGDWVTGSGEEGSTEVDSSAEVTGGGGGVLETAMSGWTVGVSWTGAAGSEGG